MLQYADRCMLLRGTRGDPSEKQGGTGMKMLLVGAGAVGESILRILQVRDPKGAWLEKVVVGDYDFSRAEEVCGHLNGDSRFAPQKLDARNKEELADVIRRQGCDFVMDAAAPFAVSYTHLDVYKRQTVSRPSFPRDLCR